MKLNEFKTNSGGKVMILIQNLTRTLFLKIAEPRVIRLMLFVIYGYMIISGLGVLYHPPKNFEGVLGLTLVYIFGSFIFIGGLCAIAAVLPGIWWLERAGIVSLISGMGLYTLAIVALGASTLGIGVAVCFGLFFAIRWQEIKRFQLAPLEPKER